MGLDVSTWLIVGVPLLELGELEEEQQSMERLNAFGEATGQTMTLRRVFLTVHSGERFEIASNKDHLLNDWTGRRVRYDLRSLFNSEDAVERWVHTSNVGDAESFVIGLVAESAKGPDVGRYGTYRKADFNSVAFLLAEVQRELESRFGYTCEVYVIAMTHYSY